MKSSAASSLSVRFWGVRGSHSASGIQYSRYGHHTCCVEMRIGERLFVIDAGTGLSALGAALGKDAPDRIDILLSHLHLDHIGGLPFCKPAILTPRTFTTYCGNQNGESAAAAFDRIFSPPIFPITLDILPSTLQHMGFRSGERLVFEDGLTVRTCALKHPSGATGYRFDHNGRSVCYLSDLEHEDPWPLPSLVEFVANADLVIYDAMFTQGEYTVCRGWGHSTWEAGVALCKAAGAKAMAVFHLHPLHDDTTMDGIDAAVAAALPGSFVAREGLGLTFEAITS